MKKDLYTLIINSILAVCITVGVVLGAPKTSVISNSKAVDVFLRRKYFLKLKINIIRTILIIKHKRTIRKKQIPLHLLKT